MLLVREVMFCKPGKVRPLVEKFTAMSKLMEKKGMGRIRVMTDVSAEQFWMLVAEIETPSVDQFLAMEQTLGNMQEFGEIMKGYHELVDHGRREIYNIQY
jgi:hypothetical protein